jgi:predicted DNA-binding transcriptional regulator AlpA
MRLTEIAAHIGISRQRVHQLSQSADFPEPAARLTMGPVWRTVDVESWARETGRLQSAAAAPGRTKRGFR